MLLIEEKFNDLSVDEQIKRFGYWDMDKYNIFDKCYFYKERVFIFIMVL